MRDHLASYLVRGENPLWKLCRGPSLRNPGNVRNVLSTPVYCPSCSFLEHFARFCLSLPWSVLFPWVGGRALTPPRLFSTPAQDAKRHGRVFNFPLVGEIDLTFTPSELVSFAVGVAFASIYTKTGHWALNNIFGITFCAQVCKLRRPTRSSGSGRVFFFF